MGLRSALRFFAAPSSVRADRAALRRRLAEVDARLAALPASVRNAFAAQARSLDGLRARIAELTGAPSACQSCNTRQPGTDPRFRGGFCCGGGTAGVLNEGELVTLRLRGARLFDAPTTSVHDGCIYRTVERGCTLDPVDRPAVCLAYACTELRVELRARGVMQELAALGDEL